MITEAFKCYLQSTYRDDVFTYRQRTLERICEWGDKYQPDSLNLYKSIIKRIKAGKDNPDKNPLRKNGKYVSLPMNNKKYVTLFFEQLQSPDKNKFDVYDFAVKDHIINASS
jgi:hypothetical protein